MHSIEIEKEISNNKGSNSKVVTALSEIIITDVIIFIRKLVFLSKKSLVVKFNQRLSVLYLRGHPHMTSDIRVGR